MILLLRTLLARPLVARLVGSIGAALADLCISHDWRTATIAGVTFLVYGATHALTTRAAEK